MRESAEGFLVDQQAFPCEGRQQFFRGALKIYLPRQQGYSSHWEDIPVSTYPERRDRHRILRHRSSFGGLVVEPAQDNHSAALVEAEEQSVLLAKLGAAPMPVFWTYLDLALNLVESWHGRDRLGSPPL